MDSNKIKERVRKGNWIKPSQDEDLAAHIMITRLYGEILIGTPIENVFGTVDSEIFLKSIF